MKNIPERIWFTENELKQILKNRTHLDKECGLDIPYRRDIKARIRTICHGGVIGKLEYCNECEHGVELPDRFCRFCGAKLIWK